MKPVTMFSSLWDYFFRDPFEMHFRLNVLAGFWPFETTVRWQKILFSLFSWICFFSVTSMAMIQILDLYLLLNNPLLFTKHLSIISLSCTITWKAHINLYRIDLINTLKFDILDYMKTRTDATDIEIIQRTDRTIVEYTKALYGIGIPTILMWIVYPGLDSSEKMALLFPYRFPIEEWTWSIYVGLYVYQTLSIVGFLLSVFSVDGIFCGFVHRICAHYDIIIKNIQNMSSMYTIDGSAADRQLKARLEENVKLHNRIIRQMKIMEDIYSQLSFIHFAMVIAAIATLVFDTLIFYRGFRLEFLHRLFLISAEIWDTFLYCSFGSKLHDKSLKLSDAIYSMNWYEMKPALRKDLIIMLLKTQRPPKFRVGKFFPLKVSSFGSFLKMIYTFISLLYQTTRMKYIPN